MFQRFFLDLKLLQSNSVATSKLLILLQLALIINYSFNFYIIHFSLTGLNSELLAFLVERTNFDRKR